jgi:xanthine dehydrogenase accessory factor
VTVLDDRAEFANFERFPEADTVRVLDDFEDGVDGLGIDADTYAVIVTRGHLYDRVVLGQVLKTEAAYIGMIGSRRKIDSIYRTLLKEGFTAADFQRVHAPIGLDIQAETPEEIAVSIVAELIQKRAQRTQSGFDP